MRNHARLDRILKFFRVHPDTSGFDATETHWLANELHEAWKTSDSPTIIAAAVLANGGRLVVEATFVEQAQRDMVSLNESRAADGSITIWVDKARVIEMGPEREQYRLINGEVFVRGKGTGGRWDKSPLTIGDLRQFAEDAENIKYLLDDLRQPDPAS